MKHYAFCRADGVVQFTSAVPDDDTEQVAIDGLTVVELLAPLANGPHRLVDGVIEPYELPPE